MELKNKIIKLLFKYKKSKNKKLLQQFLFVVIISFLFFLDGFIFSFFDEITKYNGLSVKYFLIVFCVSLLFSMTKNKKFIYLIISIFAFMSITQLSYSAYFKIPLTSIEIPLIFLEIPDIAKSGFGEFNRVYYAFIATIIPYSIMFFLIKKYNDTMSKFNYAPLIIILILLGQPVRVVTKILITKQTRTNPFSPDPDKCPVFYDGLKIYSYYLFNILPRKFLVKNAVFEDYLIEKIDSPNKFNLVLVMGESFNYTNQGLYGYKFETTPNLNKLKNNPNFIYKKGVSSATATRTSLPLFFNLQREPQNVDLSLSQKLNLFKLAKEQGFKTYLISAQDIRTVGSIGGLQYVDVKIIGIGDDKIVKKIEELKKEFNENDKNFIVLHQGACHTPYLLNYQHRKEEFNKFESNYDNCILYLDSILNDFIFYFKNEDKLSFVFITSDHGEDKYGHMNFTPEVASVPVIFYTNNKLNTHTHTQIKNRIINNFAPTHHEISLLIAELIGFKISNNNTPENIYYVSSATGKKYMKVTKIPEKKEVKYEIIENE